MIGIEDISRIVGIVASAKDKITSINLLTKVNGQIVVNIKSRDDGYFDISCQNDYDGLITFADVYDYPNVYHYDVPPFYVKCSKGEIVTIAVKTEYEQIIDDWGIMTPKDITSNNSQITWVKNIIDALIATTNKRAKKQNIQNIVFSANSDAWISLIELDIKITAQTNENNEITLNYEFPTICIDDACNYKIVAETNKPSINIPPGKTVIDKHYVLLKYQSAQG